MFIFSSGSFQRRSEKGRKKKWKKKFKKHFNIIKRTCFQTWNYQSCLVERPLHPTQCYFFQPHTLCSYISQIQIRLFFHKRLIDHRSITLVDHRWQIRHRQFTCKKRSPVNRREKVILGKGPNHVITTTSVGRALLFSFSLDQPIVSTNLVLTTRNNDIIQL